MKELTPRNIVEALDKYIIGQDEAKKTVAIALRNRFRRQQLPPEIAEEIAPKNIILIGPTGVGKTEVARRLANLVHAPFLKVEATKYTEIGYMGRDVESMIRDLTDIAVNMLKKEMMESVQVKAAVSVEEMLLDRLAPNAPEESEEATAHPQSRDQFCQLLRDGAFEDNEIDIDVEMKARPPVGIEVIGAQGNMDDMSGGLSEMFSTLFPGKMKTKKVKVREARLILLEQESQKLIDMDLVTEQALRLTENSGIVFVDEIDKIAGKHSKSGPDVSRSGVQRDLLPLVEGTSVSTKHGVVKTNHILFIAAGAFHTSKPSDLQPELQGRFPLRVTLKSLTQNDFERILVEPENALIKQYKALIQTEGIKLEFRKDAISRISYFAFTLNERNENIGARRLHTVMEKLLEEISFSAPEITKKKVIINEKYVNQRLDGLVKDEDLSKFIL